MYIYNIYIQLYKYITQQLTLNNYKANNESQKT